jgi:hypothetical protein
MKNDKKHIGWTNTPFVISNKYFFRRIIYFGITTQFTTNLIPINNYLPGKDTHLRIVSCEKKLPKNLTRYDSFWQNQIPPIRSERNGEEQFKFNKTISPTSSESTDSPIHKSVVSISLLHTHEKSS